MKRDQRYDVVIVGAAAAKAVILHGDHTVTCAIITRATV